MIKLRCRIHFYTVPGRNAIAVMDKNDGACSVTNDAKNVIAWLRENGFLQEEFKRVVYRDTEGRWDALMIKPTRNGVVFAGFKPLNGKSAEDALSIWDREKALGEGGIRKATRR